MAEFQITPEFFWLGLMILCLVIEAATVGLATIWFPQAHWRLRRQAYWELGF